ncbi:branched-chain amino acid transport system II carrier protein [Fusobacterium sp.]|uniref:branched-chain amino acid transport system II carrier protein n=1 Tax=Fusobacterium sp. TaxID=68766 RepID=UPI00396CD4F7
MDIIKTKGVRTIYKTKDVILTGFALFAMLFGAGNLIFPPSVGYAVGNNWKLAALGFCITGIGFPLLGIIASGFAGTKLDHFSDKVSPLFSKIFNTVLILAIGPCLAIPRTGATAFEIMVTPHIGSGNALWSKYIFLAVYFGFVLLFCLKESSVIERIGKILTPILLIVLAIIICKGLLSPMGDIAVLNTVNNFKYGFYNGYQTMDTLAAIIFASIILKSINSKNRLSRKEQFTFLLKASAIAVCGLAIVYCGILYIGATATGVLENHGTTQLLNAIVRQLLGTKGNVILGLCVAGACLTTAIGLTATVGDYFKNLLKVSYKKVVIVNVAVSFAFATFGVDSIVKVAAPVLTFLYPIAIVLIFLNFFKDYINERAVFIGGVIGAGLVGVVEMLLGFMPDLSSKGYVIIPNIMGILGELYSKLPFEDYGLAWVVPSIVFIGIFKLGNKIRLSQTACRAER